MKLNCGVTIFLGLISFFSGVVLLATIGQTSESRFFMVLGAIVFPAVVIVVNNTSMLARLFDQKEADEKAAEAVNVLIEELGLYYKSGNNIPVPQATISRDLAGRIITTLSLYQNELRKD